MRVPVEAGGELAEKVEVTVAVQVVECGALGAGEGDGKRRIVQHGASIAAWHRGSGLVLALQALRVGARVAGLGLGECRRERVVVGVALSCRDRAAHALFLLRIGPKSSQRT